MRGSGIRIGTLAIALVAVVATTGSARDFTRNQITLFPVGGITVAEGSVQQGTVGLGLGYTRSLGDRVGVGLKSFLNLAGLGSGTPEPKLDLEAFLELRPFLSLHGLFSQAYVKSLAFTSDSAGRLEFRQYVGGLRVGYDLWLGPLVGLSIAGGARIEAAPASIGVLPDLAVGLSLRF